MFEPLNIRIVNKNHKNGQVGEYIGRGSPLGNPFTHMPGTNAPHVVESRDMAIAKYREWLEEKILEQDHKIIRELSRLYALALDGHLTLQCFCVPKPCHGEVIRDILNRELWNQKQDQQEGI